MTWLGDGRLACGLLLALAACGGEAAVERQPVAEAPAPEAVAAAAVPLEPEPIPDGPRLRGTVRFVGQVPEARPAVMAADPFCASRHDGPVLLPTVDVDATGGLRNAVVYVADSAPAAAPVREVRMDQRGCIYEPRVLGVRAGQSIVFRNSDDTLHNVNVRPQVNDGFNVGQPVPGMETRRSFAVAEVGIPVRCDVHPWMIGFISVFDHAQFAVTDETGSFTIYGLSEGTHLLEVWHESLGTQTLEVTVRGDETNVGLEYAE